MERRGAIHHIDVTVRDLSRSTTFYDCVLLLIGFRRGADVSEGPVWSGADLEVGLLPARSLSAHDRYSPGLHHLAFAAPSRTAVDALHERLLEFGLTVLEPPLPERPGVHVKNVDLRIFLEETSFYARLSAVEKKLTELEP